MYNEFWSVSSDKEQCHTERSKLQTMSQFRVQLVLRKRPLDQPVHFKVDGGRFEEEKTVKLNMNAKYSMEFTFRPTKILE